ELFGATVKRVGLALVASGRNNIHQTLFFAFDGAIFGCLLSALQSLALQLRWRGRVSFITLSALAGSIALASVWVSHAMALWAHFHGPWGRVVFEIISVTNFVSPLMWIAYSVLTGAVLHYLMSRGRRAQRQAITSAFD